MLVRSQNKWSFWQKLLHNSLCFWGCSKREELRITTGERSPWLGLSQEDNWRVHMEGKVNVGIINASMWVREDEYISVSWKLNISPLKSLIEIISEVRESGEWRGEFSAKLDSHLPLVFPLFMFLVYDQEDANLFSRVKGMISNVAFYRWIWRYSFLKSRIFFCSR